MSDPIYDLIEGTQRFLPGFGVNVEIRLLHPYFNGLPLEPLLRAEASPQPPAGPPVGGTRVWRPNYGNTCHSYSGSEAEYVIEVQAVNDNQFPCCTNCDPSRHRVTSLIAYGLSPVVPARQLPLVNGGALQNTGQNAVYRHPIRLRDLPEFQCMTGLLAIEATIQDCDGYAWSKWGGAAFSMLPFTTIYHSPLEFCARLI